VRAALLVIQVVHRAKCLYMALDRLASHQLSVESPRHEVGAIILFEQAARGHYDPRLCRHLVVRIFSAAVISARPEFEIFSDSVKLNNPRFEPRGDIELTTPKLICYRIPSDDCFRARATFFERRKQVLLAVPASLSLMPLDYGVPVFTNDIALSNDLVFKGPATL